MSWQPISTAPKDGSLVGLWFANQPHIVRYGRWTTANFYPKAPPCWCTPRGNALSYLPGFWLPLPAPPEGEEP